MNLCPRQLRFAATVALYRIAQADQATQDRFQFYPVTKKRGEVSTTTEREGYLTRPKIRRICSVNNKYFICQVIELPILIRESSRKTAEAGLSRDILLDPQQDTTDD
jgi:hypothetical protein